ncbi:MAG: hypothetical protein AAF495_12370 [Pseudomonadota bacterium]
MTKLYESGRAAALALVAVAVVGLSYPQGAKALIMTSGCADTNLSCTLGDLAAGGSFQIDDKVFDSFVVDEKSFLDSAGAPLEVRLTF